MTEVTKLVRPAMRCARVEFFTNVTRQTNRGPIPLGVFCEVKAQHVHGLALKARTRLSDSEIDAIASPFRKALSDPFHYLSGEFDAAWAAGVSAGCALGFLTGKHSAALSVLAPYHPAAAERPSWWRSLIGGPEVNELLKNVITSEFDRLLVEVPTWDGPTPPPVLRLQLADAA